MGKQNRAKKQHYVPKFYLERWTDIGSSQVFVFDKKQKQKRKNSIKDIASENGFYSMTLSELIGKQSLAEKPILALDASNEDDQFLERFFSERVEGEFAALLSNTIERVMSMNTWELANCCFINQENKIKFSIILAVQILRGKSVRRSLDNIDGLIKQLGDVWNLSEDFVKNNLLQSKQELKCVHGSMIIDPDSLCQIATALFQKKWIVLKNETKKHYYTSDNPVFTHATKYSHFMSYDGFLSEGVEVFFPISPKLCILMINKNDCLHLEKYDNRIIRIDNLEMIESCNAYCAMKSERCVILCDGDYSTIDRLMREAPESLDVPKMSASLGNRTFYPKE